MKRILSPILISVFTMISFAQIDPSTMTYEELIKLMKTDDVLRSIYTSACNDISKNIELAAKTKELTDPINNEWTKELTKIADSLGLQLFNPAGNPIAIKVYNTNLDTAATMKFIELRKTVDNKYQPLILASTSTLRKQYSDMVMAAFTEAATKYYENLNKMTKE